MLSSTCSRARCKACKRVDMFCRLLKEQDVNLLPIYSPKSQLRVVLCCKTGAQHALDLSHVAKVMAIEHTVASSSMPLCKRLWDSPT